MEQGPKERCLGLIRSQAAKRKCRGRKMTGYFGGDAWGDSGMHVRVSALVGSPPQNFAIGKFEGLGVTAL